MKGYKRIVPTSPMIKQIHNPCIRCGKERIITKTWKEKIGTSTIINTESVCPDLECQKKVDLDNKKYRERHAAMKLKSEQRAINRRAVADAERAHSK